MRLISLLVDLFLVAIATVFALLLRENFEVSEERLIAFGPHLLFTLIAAALALPSFGIHRSLSRLTSLIDYLRICAAAVAIVAGALALGFVATRLDGIARSLPVLQGLLIVVLLVGLRVSIRLRHTLRNPVRAAPILRPTDRATVLIVGFNKLSELYIHCVAELGANRVTIAGLLDRSDRVGLSLLSHRVLGTPEQVAEVLGDLEVHGVFVDRILVAMRFDSLSPNARRALRAVSRTRTIIVDFLDEAMGLASERRSNADDAARLGARSAETTQAFSVSAPDIEASSRLDYLRVKRALDVVAATVLLVALAPVMALVGLLAAMDVGLPALFWQQRPGLGGRPFRVYKFRTMDAAYDGCGRRRTDDERVSVLGRFLRRTRLDELPQLFSILAGDMSFVGPRPLLPVDQPAAYVARLLVRPGLTGWAQIKGGRTISAADKAALDAWYVKNVSLALDIKILLGTVPMVVLGERVTERAIAEAWRDLHAPNICAAPDAALRPAYAFAER